MPEMIDMHCHIIPGVDDGARTKKDVRELLLMEYKSGVRHIVMTPHYRKGMFEPTEQLVKKRADYVRREIETLGIDMNGHVGCEYHANSEMVKEFTENKRFRMNGGKFVLVEFSSRHNFVQIRNWIYELVKAGFRPIIAHVERYHSVVKNGLDFIDELRDMGAYIQMNADSIIGEDGFMIKRFCKKVIKEEMLDFVGSDGHDLARRTPHIGKCYDKIEKMMGTDYADMIFISNPECIINNERF